MTQRIAHDGNPEAKGSLRRRVLWPTVRIVAFFIVFLFFASVTGCMERMFYQPTVGPTPPPPYAERVQFPSTDGTMLSGWWIGSMRRESSGVLAPTVVHVHGNAGNIVDHEWFSSHLPPAGFNVLLFDYRGYGESAGSARARDALIADAEAALNYVLSRADVDQARVGVYGQSLGGAIGINLMATHEVIAAGVFESPFESWQSVAASAIGGADPGAISRSLAWLLINDSRAPIEAIAEISRPVLLLHGTADAIVPVSHSRRLAAAGGSNVRLIEYAGGEHNSLRQSHPVMDDAMIDFFRTHLSAGEGPGPD